MQTILMLLALLKGFLTGDHTTPAVAAQAPVQQQVEQKQEVKAEPKEEAKPEDKPSAPYTSLEKGQDLRPSTTVKTKGEYGEVTTIAGNGVQGESDYMLDHPAYPVPDSKGNIYFLDGTQKTAKLRVIKNNKAETLLNLLDNPVTSRDGMFYKTGVAIIKDQVYFSSQEKVFQYKNGRATALDENINAWMKKNQYEYIYRMKAYDNKLVLMLYRKNSTYAFVSYDPATRKITQILEPQQYPNASNFFIQELGISVSSSYGTVYYEKFFPRKSITYLDTNQGAILDVWMDKNDTMYYVLNDNAFSRIYSLAFGENHSPSLVAGGPKGLHDGVADEVMLDEPQNFTWDGSGYIFADMMNNAIRKLWVDVAPLR